MTTTVDTVAATFAGELKAFRSANVTADNKATPFARAMLAAMLVPTGALTKALVESAVIHSFGNPKSPKTGKPVTKMSGLRDFAGGDATRKTVESIFGIFDNIDADAPRNIAEDGEPENVVGAGAIRPLVLGFVLNDASAPKSLKALKDAIKVKLADFATLIMPDNSDAKAETDAETAEQASTVPVASDEGLSLVDRVNMLILHYEAASHDDRVAAHAALENLWDMVNADVQAEVITAEEAAVVLADAA